MACNIFSYGLFVVLVCQPLCNGSTILENIENDNPCLDACKLNPINPHSDLIKFMNKTSNTAVILLYFNITIGDEPIYKITDNDDLNAWSRKGVGEPLFALPEGYMSATLFLPYFFHDTLELKVSESKPDCFLQSSKSCRKYIIFETLIEFTGINKCHADKCDTICHRRFTVPAQKKNTTDYYSCCEPTAFHNYSVDLNHCIKPIAIKNFSGLNIMIYFVSAFVSIALLFYIANRLVIWNGRYCSLFYFFYINVLVLEGYVSQFRFVTVL